MPDAFGVPYAGEDGGPPAAVLAAPAYPDMTPGVPPKAPDILSTSWKKTGSTEHGPAEPWQEQGTAFERIGRAASDAYSSVTGDQRSPTVLTPQAEDALNRTLGPVGGYAANFLPRLLGTGIADVSALGAGAGQAAQEVMRATGVSPQLRRDLTIAPSAISPALSEVSTALSALPYQTQPAAKPNPSYTGTLAPRDVVPPKPGTGLLGPATDEAPSKPTGIPGPIGAPSAVTPPAPPVITPATAGEMRPVASFLLDKARDSGADLQPDYVDKFIAKVTADAEHPGPGTAAVAGPNDPVTAMVARLQDLKGKPLSIKDVMGMDQELNARERAVINTDPDLARRLGKLQDTLRTQIDATTQADVGGGAEGWKAFQDGNAAYTQFKKMQQLEDIRDRALGAEQPATKMQSDITKWATDPLKSRGLTDEETATLKDTGERGVLGEALRAAGSRLPALTAGPVAGTLIGGGIGMLTGSPALGMMLGYPAGRMAESVASTAFRRMGINAQLGKVSEALKTLGSGVKVPPDMPWPPPAQ